MQEYLDISEQLLKCPVRKNRTGIDTTGKVFNHMELNTQYGSRFSAVTSKSLPVKSVLAELFAFWRGATSAKIFGELGCNVWYENANKHGVNPNPWLSNPFRKGEDDLGPVYGKQWRRWEDIQIFDQETIDRPGVLDFLRTGGYECLGPLALSPGKIVYRREIDQLKNTVNSIMKTPNNRRMIISSWNPGDIDKMALPPCHVLQHFLCTELPAEERRKAVIQKRASEILWNEELAQDDAVVMAAQQLFNVYSDEELDAANAPKFRLDLVMFQRSADFILGSPFNIASYDAMINFMAHITNTAPGSLHYLTSDTHIYVNHEAAALEQIERGPEPTSRARLLINPALKTVEDFDTANLDDIRLIDYVHKGKLVNPTPMAV